MNTKQHHTANFIRIVKKPLLVALVLFVVLTFALSAAMHYSESSAGTKGFGRWWDSLCWLLMYYIGNPGEIIEYNPETTLGQMVAVLAGFVKLLLFCIVTGYIVSIISEWFRSIYLTECSLKIRTLFKRRRSLAFPKRVVRPYEPVASIQARLNLTDSDIIDAVNASSDLRIRNLADGELRKDHPSDRLVVERFPAMNRSYGCCVSRGSEVTIICPTAVSEAGMGNFTWYVAQFGRFNYISREVKLPEEEDVSYYIVKDRIADCDVFLKDIALLSSGKKQWNIILIASVDEKPSCHFVYGANMGDVSFDSPNLTVEDKDMLGALLKGIESALCPFGVDCIRSGRGSGEHHLEQIIRQGSEALTVRMSYSAMLWHENRMSIAEALAGAINGALQVKPEDQTGWEEEEGDGYGYRKQNAT